MVEPECSVWKFPLRLTEVQDVEIPGGAEILHVGIQPDGLMVWARVHTSAPTLTRRFAVVGTGHPAPFSDTGQYVGTVFDGPFVWHVFVRTP